jgi:hypothetical protein
MRKEIATYPVSAVADDDWERIDCYRHLVSVADESKMRCSALLASDFT